jgi:hypothetical protein
VSASAASAATAHSSRDGRARGPMGTPATEQVRDTDTRNPAVIDFS